MRGLDPRIPLRDALHCPPKRDGRDEPGHDGMHAFYSAAILNAVWLSMSARQRARLSPSGSLRAAVRALAMASMPCGTGNAPARTGRITRSSISAKLVVPRL